MATAWTSAPCCLGVAGVFRGREGGVISEASAARSLPSSSALASFPCYFFSRRPSVREPQAGSRRLPSALCSPRKPGTEPSPHLAHLWVLHHPCRVAALPTLRSYKCYVLLQIRRFQRVPWWSSG